MSSANAFNLDYSKILLFGKGLITKLLVFNQHYLHFLTDEERYTNALSPVFKYTEGTSLKITLFLLGQSGNHGYVSLVKEDDGTEVVLFNPATPIDDIEGHFDLCLPLPNEFVDIDVRLNLSFHYAARSNPSEWLYLTMVELQDKECPSNYYILQNVQIILTYFCL